MNANNNEIHLQATASKVTGKKKGAGGKVASRLFGGSNMPRPQPKHREGIQTIACPFRRTKQPKSTCLFGYANIKIHICLTLIEEPCPHNACILLPRQKRMNNRPSKATHLDGIDLCVVVQKGRIFSAKMQVAFHCYCIFQVLVHTRVT